MMEMYQTIFASLLLIVAKHNLFVSALKVEQNCFNVLFLTAIP